MLQICFKKVLSLINTNCIQPYPPQADNLEGHPRYFQQYLHNETVMLQPHLTNEFTLQPGASIHKTSNDHHQFSWNHVNSHKHKQQKIHLILLLLRYKHQVRYLCVEEELLLSSKLFSFQVDWSNCPDETFCVQLCFCQWRLVLLFIIIFVFGFSLF